MDLEKEVQELQESVHILSKMMLGQSEIMLQMRKEIKQLKIQQDQHQMRTGDY